MNHPAAFVTILVSICVVSTSLGQDVGQLKQAKDVPGLVRLLRDRDDDVREYAGRAARHIRQTLQAAATGAKAARSVGK